MAFSLDLGNLLVHLNLDIAQYTRMMGQAEQKMLATSKRMTAIGSQLSLRVTAPIIAMGTAATVMGIKMEDAFIGVRKTVSATEEQFAALQAGFEEMSKRIPLALTELFGLGEAAGQLGIQTENILEFSEVMANLGVTTNLSAEDAATALARLANITQMNQENFDRLGATIVDLGNNFATTEAEIVTMALRVAGAGTVVGLSEDKILSFAAAMSSLGIRSQLGGTALSRVMLEMNTAVLSGTKSLKIFAAVSGQTAKDFQTLFRDDAGEALLQFIEGLQRVKDSGGDMSRVLDTLGFSGIRVLDVFGRLSSAGDLARRSIELGSEAWEENTALLIEAELRYASTASQLKLMVNQLKLLGKEFFDVLKPAILSINEALRINFARFAGLNDNTKLLIVEMLLFAAAIGPVLFALGSFLKLLITIKIALFLAAGAVTVLTGVLVGLGTAISGFKVGTFLSNEFKIVREGAAVMIKTLETIFVNMKFIFKSALAKMRIAWDSFSTSMIRDFINLRTKLPLLFGGISDATARHLEAAIQGASKGHVMLAEATKKHAAEIADIEAAYIKLGETIDREFAQKELEKEAGTLISSEAQEILNKFLAGLGPATQTLKEQFKAFMESVNSGLQEWSDNAADVASNMALAFERAFDRMSREFADFLIEGKANFADFAKSILKDILAIIIRAQIVQPLMVALGFAPAAQVATINASVPTVSAGVKHQGGVVGAGGPSRIVPVGIFSNAPRFHQGGTVGLRSNERAIIAEVGETVHREGEAPGGAPTIIINNESGQNIKQQGTPKFDGKRWIISVVAEDINQFGSLGQLIRGLR